MKRAGGGMTKTDLLESQRASRRIEKSGTAGVLPLPHRFIVGGASDTCTCGRKITDAVHQMELFSYDR